MVPHEIEPAKGISGAPHDASGEIVLAQIADETKRPPAGGGDLVDDGSHTSLVDVDHPLTAAPLALQSRNAPARPIPEAAAVTMPTLPAGAWCSV